MKKTMLLAALTLVLVLCAAAASAEPASADWKSVPHDAAVLPADAQAAFDRAIEGLDDANCVPVALLSTQEADGVNYCFLCLASPASADAEPGWALVYIHADGEGGAEISNVYELYIDRHFTPAQ